MLDKPDTATPEEPSTTSDNAGAKRRPGGTFNAMVYDAKPVDETENAPSMNPRLADFATANGAISGYAAPVYSGQTNSGVGNASSTTGPPFPLDGMGPSSLPHANGNTMKMHNNNKAVVRWKGMGNLRRQAYANGIRGAIRFSTGSDIYGPSRIARSAITETEPNSKITKVSIAGRGTRRDAMAVKTLADCSSCSYFGTTMPQGNCTSIE